MPRWKYLYTGRPSAAYRCTCGFSWRPGGVGGRPARHLSSSFRSASASRRGFFFVGFSAFGGRFSFLSAAKMSSTLSSAAADAVSDDDCAAAAAAASAFRFLAFFLSFAMIECVRLPGYAVGAAPLVVRSPKRWHSACSLANSVRGRRRVLVFCHLEHGWSEHCCTVSVRAKRSSAW
ncbi:unnamed protein product [Pelagomonas calceolata]|uniref:Uncharacterized protein n=1 Tax=Pelagomonas calceolata TaxID=35677 RepID=A0A8J2ST14_9STRA|nr:unnamed protein product [Pelagomonas calceolata]